MARKATGGRASWEWSRTAQTRRKMLDAAREVFCERGFSEASVSDVVKRSGSSVGSLYHHFGGKNELFIALWTEHQDAHEKDAAAGVAKAERDGVTDPMDLFTVGARTYLQNAWERRDLERLAMDGGGPPGFELMRRTRRKEWIRQNAVLLGAQDDPLDRLTVSVLTSAIGEALWEVATSDTREDACEVIEAAITLLRRFGRFGRDADRGDAPA